MKVAMNSCDNRRAWLLFSRSSVTFVLSRMQTLRFVVCCMMNCENQQINGGWSMAACTFSIVFSSVTQLREVVWY